MLILLKNDSIMLKRKKKERYLPNKSILCWNIVGSNKIPSLQDAHDQIALAIASATTPSLVFESDADVAYNGCFFEIVQIHASVGTYALATDCSLQGRFVGRRFWLGTK